MSLPIEEILGDRDLPVDEVGQRIAGAYQFGAGVLVARQQLLGDIATLIDEESLTEAQISRAAEVYRLQSGDSAIRGSIGVLLVLTAERRPVDYEIESMREANDVIQALFDLLELRRIRTNILPRLPEDPSEAIALIKDHYGFGATKSPQASAVLLHHVDMLLREEPVDQAVAARVIEAYRASPPDADYRGQLGLFTVLHEVTASALLAYPRPGRDCTELVRHDAAVREALFALYEIDPEKIAIDDAELRRIGTTSFIIRARWRQTVTEHVAVKCLLPRYFRLHRIREQTLAYAHRRLPTSHAPEVISSSERTIVMEYVEGDTLADEIAARAVARVPPTSSDRSNRKAIAKERRTIARQRALQPHDVERIRGRFAAICDAMAELYAANQSHLDLSPTNIIVVDEDIDDPRVVLIDFGRNFTVTERVGPQMALPQNAIYVSRELQEDPEAGDYKSDAYSLGVILLEMVACVPLSAETLTSELDRVWVGDEEEVWSGAPGIARIIEDLVDSTASNRLLLAPSAGAPDYNPFSYLSMLVRQEAAVQEMYEEQTKGHGFGRLEGLGLLLVRRNVQVTSLLEARSKVRRALAGTSGYFVEEAYEEYPALGRWAAGSLLCWSLVLGSFLALTGADLGVPIASSAAQWFVRVAHPHFQIGLFWHNIAGRVVALTFSAANVTYYVNIYSTLLVKTRREPRPPLLERLGVGATNAAMRMTSVLLTIPVMWAMVWNPRAWPLCCGFGTLPIVLNNLLTLRVAQRASAAARQGFSTYTMVWERFVRDTYSEWWTLMGLYSLSFIVVGFLLNADIAHDVGIYAAIVCVINVLKMYRLNCVQLAPQVRGWLGRSIVTLRRAGAVGRDSGASDERPTTPVMVSGTAVSMPTSRPRRVGIGYQGLRR